MGGVIVGLVVQELICTAAGGLSKILFGLHGAMSLSPAYRLHAGRQTVSNVHV